MNDQCWGNRIGAYRLRIILLFLIIMLTPTAAADTMFHANAEHTGIFDNGGIGDSKQEVLSLHPRRYRMVSSMSEVMIKTCMQSMRYRERRNGGFRRSIM
jgi:UV DNA damage repair endonuclease